MGRPELADDPRFENMKLRSKHIDEVDEIVNEWTSTLPRSEITRIAQEHGVICAPVQTIPETLEDPHMLARGSLQKRQQPGIGDISQFQTPIRFRNLEPPELTDVADLGADTDQILMELADVAEGELDELRSKKVII